MTLTVDERKRLVADALAAAEVGEEPWKIVKPLCDQIEADGKRLSRARDPARHVGPGLSVIGTGEGRADVNDWQPRERASGRYAFSGDQERLCTCGHKLGVHTAEPPHECMNGDLGIAHFGATGVPCDCQRFRPSRKSQANP